MNATFNSASTRYIMRIRNLRKRDYARAYAEWLQAGAVGETPTPQGKLSPMGAQSVRIALGEILRDCTESEVSAHIRDTERAAWKQDAAEHPDAE